MANNPKSTPQVDQNEDQDNDFIQITDPKEALKEFSWDKQDGKTQIGDEPTENNVLDEANEEEEIEEEETETEEQEEETEEEETETETEKLSEEEKEAKKKGKEKSKPKDKEDNEPLQAKEEYAALANDLVEDGLIQYAKVPKKDKLTTEELVIVVNEEVEGRVDAGLKEMFEGLDEKATSFLKFLKDGGKTEDFIDTFVTNVVPDDLDLSKEKGQKDFLAFYLEEYEKLDEEEVKDRIEYLKEKGKLESEATKRYARVKEDQEQAKVDLLKKQEAKSKKEEKERQDFSKELTTTFNKKEIKGISLTDKDSKTLPDYITKAVHKSGNLKITKLQKRLQEALNNPEELVLLAKICESDFDFGFAKIKGQTEATKKLRKNLENMKQGGKDPKSLGSKNRSLADFFPG